MKKVIYTLSILCALCISDVVFASSFKTELVGEEEFKTEITLYLEVSEITDFTGSCSGLCGLVGKLNYDTSKLELISINSLEDFELINGENVVLYKNEGINTTKNILELNFKNKGLKSEEATVVSLINIVASDGGKDIMTADVSKTIKLEKSSIIDIVTSTFDRNYLKSIELSTGVLKFDKDTFIYNINVSYETTEMIITADAFDSNSIITGSGKKTLNVGLNVIKISVESTSGDIKTYTLNITRQLEDEIITEPTDNQTDEPTTNDTTQTGENNNTLIIIIVGILISAFVVKMLIKKNK